MNLHALQRLIPLDFKLTYVMFAIDQTLIDTQSAVRAALNSCRLHLHVLRGALPGYWSIDYLERLHRQVLREESGPTQFGISGRRESLRRGLLTLGAPMVRHLDDLEQLFLQVRYHPRWFFPETLSTLRYLSERYSLGVISNGDSDLEKLGISEHFNFQMYTRQLPWKKPDPRIFSLIQSHSGRRQDEILYIGDDPLNDIHCARLKQMPAIWINRKHKTYPGHLLPPTAETDNLESLGQWL